MVTSLVSRVLVLAGLALVAALAYAPTPARADGDPASDYLLGRQVFLSAQGNPPTPAQEELQTLVAQANRRGFAIRVAVIPSEYDLGSITELWRKPTLYARFLGLELGLNDRQRLLVVMPNGFGFEWAGHPAAPADRVLGSVTGADLDRAAQAAVTRLAAAAGIRLVAPTPKTSPPSREGRASAHRGAGGGLAASAIAAIAIGALIAGGLIVLLVRRTRRRRRVHAAPPTAGTPRWRVLIPGIAGILAVAGATPIVLLLALRHSSAPAATNPASVVTPPALSWRPGARLAPDFALRDQYGRPVSISRLRGRTVILTFTDPLCRNLCPIEAHMLNYVVGRMPAGRRPEIVAVSVDVAADSRADLLLDERRWELVPQWHWAVGTPAALARVWKSYAVGVSVVTKRVGGVTLNYILHTEAAYVIDATGHERALFVWPYFPQDLERTLSQLS